MSNKSENRNLPFTIHQTEKTPGFEYNPDTNTIVISGKSIPEDHKTVFDPILDWLTIFISNPPEKTLMVLKLNYFNSASSRYFMKILKKLEEIMKAGQKIEIHWVYERDDTDMYDCGLDYKELDDIPFSLIEVEELN